MSKSDDPSPLPMVVRMPIPPEEASLQLHADVGVLLLLVVAVKALDLTKMLRHEAASNSEAASLEMSLLEVAEPKVKQCKLTNRYRTTTTTVPRKLAPGNSVYDVLPSARRRWMCTSLGKVLLLASLLHVISA